jgi:hypothetical protein
MEQVVEQHQCVSMIMEFFYRLANDAEELNKQI